MAQPATKRTPLGIDPFWDIPRPDPPLRWEKWRVQYKLAMLDIIIHEYKREYYSRYAAWTQIRDGGTSP